MKQLSILVLVSAFSTQLSAQLTKGQWLAGGSAGFSYQNIGYNYRQFASSDKITTEQLAPGAGYFFINKLARVTLNGKLFRQ